MLIYHTVKRLIISRLISTGGDDLFMKNRDIFGKLTQIQLLTRLVTRQVAFPLYPGQYPVMEAVYDHNGCTQKELADMLMVTPASVAVSAKRLEKSGFITRKTDDCNARCNRLSITEQGIDALKQCRIVLDMVDERAIEGFSEDDLKCFASYLDRIIFNLEKNADRSDPCVIAALAGEIADNDRKSAEKQEVDAVDA